MSRMIGNRVEELTAWKKHKWRSGYTKYERITIDGSDAPTIKINWPKKGFDKVLTFTQGKDVKEISYKERQTAFHGGGGIAEWKITGIVTIKNRPDLPGKKETITFKFLTHGDDEIFN